MGEGEYRFRIEVSHVYMGPHQHDKLYSVDLRIVNVDYTPLADLHLCDADVEERDRSYKPQPPSGGLVYKPLLQRQNAILPSSC